MSGTTTIRVADLPDLGVITDTTVFVADKAAATGKFTALTIKNYVAITTLPEAPSTNTPYGRMNGAWTPVLNDAPSNGMPYARMNAAWTQVVPLAPVDGQTYGRSNAGWVPVLPITGGSLAGNLYAPNMTTGGLYANTLSMSSADNYEWFFYTQAGTGDHIQQHRGGWYDLWQSSSGVREWVNPNGIQMALDAAGSLNVTGNLSSNTAVWVSPGAFGFAPTAFGTRFYFGAQYFWDWNSSNGQLTWFSNGTQMWNMRALDGMTINSVAAVGGVGAYVNSSDRRMKEAIAPATEGLAEVLALQPMTFTRTRPPYDGSEPPPDRPMEIGFIAQDVATVLPEAVHVMGIELADGTGGLDSGDPTLGVSEATITAISVNAIKELNAMIAALTTRVATLEGAA